MSILTKDNRHHYWYAAISGLCALLIGIGLCRFAYTPLITELIDQKWITKSGAGYLGSINFLGYIFGAILGQRLNRYLKVSFLIRTNLLLSIVSLGLCAWNFGFWWFAFWRFLAGVTGAMLMVLTPSVVLKNVPVEYKGRVAGIVFTGLGLGTIISGLLLPTLAEINLVAAWLGAAGVAVIATAICWPEFSNSKHGTINPVIQHPRTINVSLGHRHILALLVVAYALFGIGGVPHSLFLVDYVHQQLGYDLVMSGMFWTLFGIGSVVGPFCVGFIADKIGVYRSLIIAFICSSAFVSLVLFNKLPILYAASSFLAGAIFPGIVTLVSARIVELVGTEFHPVFWARMTVSFAISQTIASYFMSYLLYRGIEYTACFMVAAMAFVIGLVIVVLAKTKKEKV